MILGSFLVGAVPDGTAGTPKFGAVIDATTGL
jgi:hypothetical protein